ncbi:MAG: 30S ribosomal protein S4 [Candidatus Aenigmarchaeota archaeon]|nr:30S ribosomal protein S4 [Candidatus Aenigmarchaeota archaeon]
MGHPKKQRKKYEKPFKPFDKDRIEKEKKLMGEYGLKRKHEIWRANSILRNFRRRARDLQASRNEQKKAELLERMNTLGITCVKLEDVLDVKVEDILSRRLQTIIFKKNIVNTPKQSRQLIVHGHVRIQKRKILWPGYIVPAGLEDTIEVSPKMRTKFIEESKEA